MTKTMHQMRVNEFMLRASQEVPIVPTKPSMEVRTLRACLILEEAIETIDALGGSFLHEGDVFDMSLVEVRIAKPLVMVAVVDGCCDLKVVATGTLSACGISDKAVQEAVDQNNLEKFKPGYEVRADGKLIKPPGHMPPDLVSLIEDMG